MWKPITHPRLLWKDPCAWWETLQSPYWGCLRLNILEWSCKILARLLGTILSRILAGSCQDLDKYFLGKILFPTDLAKILPRSCQDLGKILPRHSTWGYRILKGFKSACTTGMRIYRWEWTCFQQEEIAMWDVRDLNFPGFWGTLWDIQALKQEIQGKPEQKGFSESP